MILGFGFLFTECARLSIAINNETTALTRLRSLQPKTTFIAGFIIALFLFSNIYLYFALRASKSRFSIQCFVSTFDADLDQQNIVITRFIMGGVYVLSWVSKLDLSAQ